MHILYPKVWREFQSDIEYLSEESTPREFLHIILSWLRKYPNIVELNSFSAYRVGKFLSVEEDRIPVDFSEERGKSLTHSRDMLLKYTYKDSKIIGMILNDVLYQLCFFETDRCCMSCGSCGMFVHMNKVNNQLAYECITCSHIRYADETKADIADITFADVDTLKKEGLISA